MTEGRKKQRVSSVDDTRDIQSTEKPHVDRRETERRIDARWRELGERKLKRADHKLSRGNWEETRKETRRKLDA